MIPLVLWNLALVAAAILLPNEFLIRDSWILYGLQAVAIVPYALSKTRYASHLFMPSLFTLAYFSVNLTFGGFLVPREFGFNKEYTEHVLAIGTYNHIVPYMLLCNLALFAVTMATVRELEQRPGVRDTEREALRIPTRAGLLSQAALLVGFVICSYFDFTGAFSIQLAFLVVHIAIVCRQRASYRYALYVVYLLIEVALNFDNKREVIIVLFLFLFLESYYRRTLLKLSLGNVIAYVAAATSFLGLVVTASILRGYGGFRPTSVFGAIKVIPDYAATPIFVDALVENLELNYNYGASVTSIDFVMRGKLDYLLGLSFWKVLFLPIPRDLLGWKPESVMQLYTKAYDPAFWQGSGSLPVVFSSEMFVNFGHFGILPFALVWMGLNKIFVSFHHAEPHSFWYHSSAFLCVTTLVFARGSGLELYVLTYLFAIPILMAVVLLRPWRRNVPLAAGHAPRQLA